MFWGWVVGLEPTTFGTTIRRSNQLNYTHHVLQKHCKVRHNFLTNKIFAEKYVSNFCNLYIKQ